MILVEASYEMILLYINKPYVNWKIFNLQWQNPPNSYKEQIILLSNIIISTLVILIQNSPFLAYDVDLYQILVIYTIYEVQQVEFSQHCHLITNSTAQ